MQVKRQPFDYPRFCAEMARYFPCQHPRVAPCEKIKVRTGIPYYRRQCPDCGAALSQQLKYSEIESYRARGGALGVWNEELYREIGYQRFLVSRTIKQKFGWDSAGFWFRYDKYLLSDEWRALRERILKRDNYTCQKWCRNPAVQVHHETYDRVGFEEESDLTSVCLECHQRLHGEPD